MENMICGRCGIDFTMATKTLEKRKLRDDNKQDWCNDCRGQTTGTKCKPHRGELCPDTWRPIDRDGKLVLAGVRLCGNADCVNLEHIVLDSTLELVQPKAFKGTKEQVWVKVSGERIPECSVQGCLLPSAAMSMCRKHHLQDWRKRRKLGLPRPDRVPEVSEFWDAVMDVTVCLVANCEGKVHARSFCRKHYFAGYRRAKKQGQEKN